VSGTASGRSAAQPSSNLKPAPRCRQPEDVHVKMTYAPMRARTSTPTPMVMPRRSSGGHRKTSPLLPCCCAVVRRHRPLRKGECTSS
jgi:hypothetical protein